MMTIPPCPRSLPIIDFNNSNTTDATRRAGTVYCSGASEFISFLNGVRVAQLSVFCEVLCGPLFVFFALFRLIIVLSVLNHVSVKAKGYSFNSSVSSKFLSTLT